MTMISPGMIIWKLYGNKKGKISLMNRDIICDSETLINLPKSGKPLDGFTNALCPFLPTFLLNNDLIWKQRREVFSHGNSIINERILSKHFQYKLETKQGNILWDVFQLMSKISFELIFNRLPTDEEWNDIYPGLLDINFIIKRFTSKPNIEHRNRFYNRILQLINSKEKDFIFYENETFEQMNEIHQVSSVGEDFLTTMSVQCSDLVCHMLILYSEYPDQFHENVDYALNETLRLYPLTDLWTRQEENGQRGWIASLVQLNRNGWNQPDQFLPQRWEKKDHPLLMSWGFDVRRCPAQKLATNLSKFVFQSFIQNEHFWVIPAKNFQHERTFPFGCQLAIGHGQIPSDIHKWTFPGKFQMQFRRWLCEKLRMIDQRELN